MIRATDRHVRGLVVAVGIGMWGCVPTMANAQTLYGGNGSGSAGAGSIVTVSQTTGAGTFIGDPVTPGGLSGIAFAGPNLLYGSTIRMVQNISTLVKVNPDTGLLDSTVGTITLGPTGAGISIGDLAWNPVTGTLFGIGSNAAGNGGLLYTIDTTTAVATFVGNTGAGAGGGIAFSPTGTLYQTSFNNAFDFPSLNVLDPTNAARISTIQIIGYFDGLAVRPSDGLLFAATGGTSDDLYTIDPGTGAATHLGNTGTGSTSDLDFRPSAAVPEPGALALLGSLAIPAAMLLRRRRA